MSRHLRGRSNSNSFVSPSRNSSFSSNTHCSEMSFESNSGPSDEHRLSRFGFRSSLAEIERWLDNQVTISTTHLISYLSSLQGLDILRQIADNRSLSSQIVIKLAKLVTQDGIRSSVEKYDTNKIYGVFLGSAFLTQIQAHVGAMIAPNPNDLWAFVHLFVEMQNRMSDGWRFLPAETLREAIDGIPEGAEKFQLYQQLCRLVEYRSKMKRLQQLSKLEEHYQAPMEPPNWEDVFEDTRLPLMVDIGSGSGRFLILLAKRFLGSKNFLGLDIRDKLVQRSQFWAKELTLSNIHFMVANATFTFGTLVSTYPGPMTCVSILCPDPHFKKKHHKRRILQEPLVDAIINNLACGGQILVQSDVHEVAVDMRQHFDGRFDSIRHMDAHYPNLCDDDGWLLENPIGIRTEREIHAQSEGAKIYRRMYEKM